MSLVRGLKTKLKSLGNNGETIMSNEVMKKDSGSLALFGDDAAKGF